MNYKVCDIHTHLLPMIDDGPNNIEMSMEMLRSAYSQGTRSIVCTSHSWGNMSQYYSKLKEIQDLIKQECIDIMLYSGCEIDFGNNNIDFVVDGLQNGTIPTINGTQYILIEFSPHASAEKIVNDVDFLQKRGYKIIIAHIERYQNLFAEKKCISLLQSKECLFQINIYSVYDEKDAQIKGFARSLLKESRVSFLGSDAHRTNHRPYMIKNGIDYLYNNFETKYIENICYKNAEHILNIKQRD